MICIHYLNLLGYNKVIVVFLFLGKRRPYIMGTVLILGVMVAFLVSIFTAGYDDKPGKHIK